MKRFSSYDQLIDYFIVVKTPYKNRAINLMTNYRKTLLLYQQGNMYRAKFNFENVNCIAC